MSHITHLQRVQLCAAPAPGVCGAWLFSCATFFNLLKFSLSQKVHQYCWLFCKHDIPVHHCSSTLCSSSHLRGLSNPQMAPSAVNFSKVVSDWLKPRLCCFPFFIAVKLFVFFDSICIFNPHLCRKWMKPSRNKTYLSRICVSQCFKYHWFAGNSCDWSKGITRQTWSVHDGLLALSDCLIQDHLSVV